MAAPTIKNGEEHFFTTLYEGNGAGQRVGKFVPFTDNGTIANSVIYNRTDNPRLAITPSSAGNRKTWTFSAWIKRTILGSPRHQILNVSPSDGASGDFLYFDTNNTIKFTDATSSNYTLITNRTFEDTSKFYHLLISADSTQSTAANRLKIYIDGEQITSFSTETYMAQDYQFEVNNNSLVMNLFGDFGSSNTENGDGYFAEVNMVDGTALTPSTFGLTDTSTGRWIPKTLTGITYGTNGFRLKFQDSSALGDDTSGNGNDLTAANLASTDQTTDSPTQNFTTFMPNRVYSTAQPTAEGNLQVKGNTGTGYPKMGVGKSIPQSGKWYWEQKLTAVGGYQGIANPSHGVIDLNLVDVQNLSNANFQHTKGGMGAMMESGFKFSGLLSTATDFTTGSTSNASGDYMLFAFDMDNGKAWFGHYDASGTSTTWFANDGGTDGNPSTGANPTVTFNPSDHRFLPMAEFFAPGSGYAATYDFNFGSKAYAFTAPTGFGKLSQQNFPETAKGISGLVWIKDRDATRNHNLFDSSRGIQKELRSNSTDEQFTNTDTLNKFLIGGCQVEDNTSVNNSGNSYVNWNWVANSGTTSSNGDGNVTCTLQVNSTAKFSIQTWTNTGAGTKTIGHGLGVKPGLVIQKRTETTSNWFTYHHKLSGNGSYLHLNNTDTTQTGSDFANTEPTSSVFSSNASGSSSATFVSYCWAEVDGFSKFGSYLGNGNADGTFVYTGFKPAFVMVKGATNSGSWVIMDSKRDPFNAGSELYLLANSTDAEAGSIAFDFISNGFKCRDAASGLNASGVTYIYIAFAEHPFVGDGTNPVTAR